MADTPYKGTAFLQDVFYSPGDWVLSPNKQFAAALGKDGSLGIYWLALMQPVPDFAQPFAVTYPPFQSTPAGGPSDSRYFMIMQSDGNFCIYRGTNYQDNEGAVWASAAPPRIGASGFKAELKDEANIVVVASNGTMTTGFGHTVQRAPVVKLVSMAILINWDGTTRRLALSSVVPTGPDDAKERFGGSFPASSVSVQVAGDKIDSQRWVQYTWEVGNDYGPNRVFINAATGLALKAGGEGVPVTQTAHIDGMSIWTCGEREEDYFKIDNKTFAYAIRPLDDIHQNLNVFGNGPYNAGCAVITWRWPNPPPPNIVWEMQGA